MQSSFERFLAYRYLTGAVGQDGKRGFLRFVTLVAVGGVAVGVAALLIALAIVRGFSEQIEARIVGFGAHVQLESLPDAPLDGAPGLIVNARQEEGVLAVDEVVQEFVLLRRSSQAVDGASIWGTTAIPAYVADRVEGSARLDTLIDGQPVMVLGAGLARNLQAQVGQRVTAFSVRNAARPDRGSVRIAQFVIGGIFETDLADFDDLYAFAAIDEARDLVAYRPDQVTRLDIRLADPGLAVQKAVELEKRFAYPVMARSIYEVHRSLFAWVELQEAIIPLVIAVIILVASFNIIGTLLMIMLEKTREVGILRSLGASADRLRRAFLMLGVLIGATGMVLGELLALGLALLQQEFSLIRLPADAYFMSVAPVALSPWDFLWVAMATIVLCGLSAYLPARFAARIDPMRAIHFK
ncbi:MAG: ABC transporter permease [Rhodothermales bacterium]|nr:ABC transporter permease [Rhodothermales bacterium]MBO6781532.1 ABC transporter permease [Rhodothermales bacterium]